MEEHHLDPALLKKKESTVNGLGIAGLITGIMTFLLAFIPCIGVFAIFIGIVSLTLSIIGITMASKYAFSKGLLIGGLVTAGLGCILAISQLAAFGGIGSQVYEDIQTQKNLHESGYYDNVYESEDSIIIIEEDSIISEEDSLR